LDPLNRLRRVPNLAEVILHRYITVSKRPHTAISRECIYRLGGTPCS
jgi:hypothetical protein